MTDETLNDHHDRLATLDVELSALSALTDPNTPQGKLARHCAMLAGEALNDVEGALS